MKLSQIFFICIILFLSLIISNFSIAWVTPANMRTIASGDFTHGCLINGRIYYRSLGNNLINTNSNGIIDYRIKFDPNFSVAAICPTKGAAIIGLIPSNPSVQNTGSGGTTPIGCTISTGTAYSSSTLLNSNLSETNVYNYLLCPLDESVILLILPLVIFSVCYSRKQILIKS